MSRLGLGILSLSLMLGCPSGEGLEGPEGPPGAQGPEGPQGPAGPEGAQGPQGVEGPVGPAGEQGAQGPQGVPGVQGLQGPEGAQGAAGAQGAQGVPGLQGLKGDPGAKGDTGEKGDKGDKGDTGAQGDAGPKGDTGDKGDTGAQGDAGPKGDTGAQGDAGPKGDTGAKGDKGDPGDPASIAAGSGLALSNSTMSVLYGTTAGTSVQGNDSRLSDARAPTAGSSSYIQNGTVAQTASFNISGLGEMGRLSIFNDLGGAGGSFSPYAIEVKGSSNHIPSWNGQTNFLVGADGLLMARGSLGIGIIPVEGPGERFLWHIYRGALRAGGVNGTQWNDSNIGFYSAAFGQNSQAEGNWSLAAGYSTFTDQPYTVALGRQTSAIAEAAFAMGRESTASGIASSVIGYKNVASADYSFALGRECTASANYSSAQGLRNTASGEYSHAFGTQAKAIHQGAFVFADSSYTDTTTFFSSTRNNELAVRVAGGVRFRTNATASTGCDLTPGSGTWACTSDRALKHDFRSVDGEEVLSKIAAMPIQSWRYRSEPGNVRHLGPVAQDFRAAFGLGTDDRTIGLFDYDGINMLAIQALQKRTAELRSQSSELDALRAEVKRLHAERKDADARLERLEGVVNRLARER
jgi:hypothetical protein